jgi:SAM-dependent methyltransferase
MSAPCPICQKPLADRSEPKPLIRSYGGHRAELKLCTGCSHVSFSPLPDPELLDEFYVGSDSYSGNGAGYGSPRFANTAKFVVNQVAELGGDTSSVAVLDYGCGAGGNVDALRALGVHAVGTDLNPAAIADGRSQGNDHIWEADESQHLLDGSQAYDAIVLYHVVEHLADPLGKLAELAPLLKPTGCFVIYCPNGFYTPSLVLGPEIYDWVLFPLHLNYFSPWSVRALGTELGFSAPHISTTAFETRRDLWHPTQVLAPNLAQQRTLGGRELRAVLTKSALPNAELDPPDAPLWRWNRFKESRHGSIIPALVDAGGSHNGWTVQFGADEAAGELRTVRHHRLVESENSWIGQSAACISPTGFMLRTSTATCLDLRVDKRTDDSPPIEVRVTADGQTVLRQEVQRGELRSTVDLRGAPADMVTVALKTLSPNASSIARLTLDAAIPDPG